MNAILQAVASAKSAKKPDTRSLGEKMMDDRWGPPGVRREQPGTPEFTTGLVSAFKEAAQEAARKASIEPFWRE